MTAAPQFTASQLAVALDKAPRSVRRALDGVPHSSVEIVNGSEAKVWSLESLPSSLRAELDAQATAKNYRDALAMLRAPAAAAWQPRIPLNEVAEEFRRKAVKLQRALLPPLARMDANMSAAEFERLGLNDYAGIFGERISDRHFRALLKRILARDGGREDWQRLEIFLAENTHRAPMVLSEVAKEVASVFPLVSKVPVRDVTNPTWREMDLLWQAALESFSDGCAEASHPPKLKRQIIEALMQRVPRIALTFNSARTNFDLKFKAWTAGGKTLASITNKKYRASKPPKKTDPAFTERAERLGYLAGKKYGKHRAPAFRDLVEQGLEQPTNSSNLAYVPRALLRASKQDALITAASVKNKRALRSMVPTLSCDPGKWKVHDRHTFDDVTIPILWSVPDGKGWFDLVQGQCLIGADWRSWRILGFSLQPQPQYNTKVIFTLFGKTWRPHALPKEALLEGGMWESGSLLHGNDAKRKAVEDMGLEYTAGDVIHGLQTQLGIKISHARSPTGKSQIESIMRLIQDYMWGDKGYCGRDQRTDLPDHVKRQKYLVETRQAHPSKFFYSFAQMEERLHQIFTEYNAKRQRGDWLWDESPDEAYEKYQNREDPPIAFDARCAHILARQVSIRELKDDHTIRFRIGREKFSYFDTRLMEIPARTRLMAHFDPEFPGSIVITDLNRQNPITVPRSNRTGDTDDPDTQKELGKKTACASYLRARFRTLEAKHKPIVRTPVVSDDTAALGAYIEGERTAAIAEQKRTAKTRRAAAKVNLHLSPAARRNAETPDAIKDLEQFLNSTDDEPDALVSAPKTYVLTSPVTASLPKLRAQLWGLWNRVEKLQPGLNRHALTHKALGYVRPVKEMTAEELARVMQVLSAIARDAKRKTE